MVYHTSYFCPKSCKTGTLSINENTFSIHHYDGSWGSWVSGSLTDTKNTAGSTDTSSKIFLIGATSQAANPTTYSDNQVYTTNGQLNANTVRVAEKVTLQYNSSTESLDFVFA